MRSPASLEPPASDATLPSERLTASRPLAPARATACVEIDLDALEEHPPVPSELDSDRFEVREVLGRGGSGVVLRAFDKTVLRDVAIKVLDADRGDDSRQQRFANEARIMAQLEHPNIVPVYDCGVDRHGRRYLCMKLVEGDTLENTLLCAGASRLEPERLTDFLEIFTKVCDAVSFAHSRGVLHRDLKPINVMISDFGQVYVLDWGIAQLLPPPESGEGARWSRVRLAVDPAIPPEVDPPGTPVGTARYMAPEQIHGHNDRLDERTDVYSLGATLYQILAGRPPRTSEIVQAMRARGSCPPIPPPERLVEGGVPGELSKIAMRALSIEPSDRYPSVAAMKRDVERFRRDAWIGRRIKVSAGSTVVAEGDGGDAAYVIVAGQCAAYQVRASKEVKIRSMGLGEVFGEMAVFSDKPRTATVKAETDVELLVVTRGAMSTALGLDSWVGTFVRALTDRFLEADGQLRAVDRLCRVP
jgi:predicted Ser/Thr protein kinase